MDRVLEREGSLLLWLCKVVLRVVVSEVGFLGVVSELHSMMALGKILYASLG